MQKETQSTSVASQASATSGSVFSSRLPAYLSIPYKHRGSDWNGADCYGIVRLFYEAEFGIALNDYKKDTASWRDPENMALIRDNAEREFKRIRPESAVFGDGVIFLTKEGCASHMGIIVAPGRILHMQQSGASINSIEDIARGRTVLFYRFRGMA